MLVSKFGKRGSAFVAGEFDHPYGITIDNNYNLYAVDSFNSRIKKFIISNPIRFENFKKELIANNNTFQAHPVEPELCIEGSIYLNSTDNFIYQYEDGSWAKVLE